MEHASQEGERSKKGVEKAHLTNVDTLKRHIVSQLLVNPFGMQEQTLQHDSYVAANCKLPLGLKLIS